MSYPPQGYPPPGVEVHGADKHTDVTRELFIGIQELAHTAVEDGIGLKFEDANFHTGKFYFKVPDDFVSFSSIKAVWKNLNDLDGNMYWNHGAAFGANGEAYGTHVDGPAYGTTAISGTDTFCVQEAPNPLTMSNLAKGDYIYVDVKRNATEESDTLEGDIYLIGILFTYIAEQ